ncbi:MAG: SLATT domain-containing protein [Thermomicrobiales bacterium]
MEIELDRVREDATFSAKGHFNASMRWGQANYILGVPAAVLSAIAGVSALSQFNHHNTVAGVLAIIVAAITGISTFLNPSERAANHYTFGNRFNSLKNRCRLVVEIDGPTMASSSLRARLAELCAERDELNASAPQIPSWAYSRARKGIGDGESDYSADSRDQAVELSSDR